MENEYKGPLGKVKLFVSLAQDISSLSYMTTQQAIALANTQCEILNPEQERRAIDHVTRTNPSNKKLPVELITFIMGEVNESNTNSDIVTRNMD